MLIIIWLSIGLVIGIAFGFWVGRKSSSRVIQTKFVNKEQIETKQENLRKILQMAIDVGEVSNDMVEKGLRVSNATAERYLQELEEQGKLQQIGTRGRSVIYKAV